MAQRVPLVLSMVLVAACEPRNAGPGPNQRPTATITTPVAAATYAGGDVITYGGGGTDPEDGVLPAASLTWWADFHHDAHTHPFLPLTAGSAGGTIPIPTAGETSDNVFYRFYLVVVDDDGAADTVFRDVMPRKVSLTLATLPAGLQVTLDGQPRTTPLTVQSVVGIQREIGAVSPQTPGATTYLFASWSDGGAATHLLATPATSTTYTATFTAVAPNTPPTATITAPAVAATYAGGDIITYSGSATDPEDGVLPAARLSWWADFHHDAHTHPFLPLTAGSAGGTIPIPTAGETSDNVFYRFYLVALDDDGAADTVFRDVLPRKVSLTLATSPAGLQVTLDGQPRTAPHTVLSVVGIEREIGAVTPQNSGGTTYVFTSWSDGGAATHMLATPASNTTYTATFTATAPNTPPTVSLTAPAAGDSAEVSTPVTVSANAADADGTVTGVQFFDGATSIGSDTSNPYNITWTPTVVGTRDLTARATDDDGATTTSAPVSFKVFSPAGPDTEAPVATMTAPADQATGLNGAVTLTANATDNVGVAGVQFQVDGLDLGAEDTSAPYSVVLPATSVYTTGVHVFRARARDAAGNLSPWSTRTVAFGGAVNLAAGFSRTTFTSGLSSPTAMAFSPDGRLFVCQQDGQLRVVPLGGGASTLFHAFSVNSLGERGLLGVAFHPDFATNRWIYVYYTTAGAPIHNRISRIRVSAGNPNVSDTTETVLVDLPNLNATNHNGGAIHFSPTDGKLYVAVGENAVGSNAQSLNTRFGKVLRYNADSTATIPSDNPFMGMTTGANQAIWALGLRNPFTFNIQPGTGRIFINDVGENSWEEINDGIAGSNYGWPTTEGPTANPAFRSPVYAYHHSQTLVSGIAIVGAAFYNPAVVTFPASYVGHYFFADYLGGWINRFDPVNGAAYAFARIPSTTMFGLEVGPDGGLYALVNGGAGFVVWRYQAP